MTKVLGFLFISMLAFTSCEDHNHDHENDEDPEYSITVMNPTIDSRTMNDSMHIYVNFDSETMSTIHHINVNITNTANDTELFNMPSEAHVHDDSGHYEFHADFNITEANGFEADATYLFEAKVWGHEAGKWETTSQVQFVVNPE